jgi:hypothetical protein
MSYRRPFIAAVLALSICWDATAAELDSTGRQEVEQLLLRLAESGCRFQRNGTWHSATDARLHLQKKYQYLLDKRLMNAPEDFIALAATKSSVSGKPYTVKCGTQEPVTSAGWMTARLKEVRAKTR